MGVSGPSLLIESTDSMMSDEIGETLTAEHLMLAREFKCTQILQSMTTSCDYT